MADTLQMLAITGASRVCYKQPVEMKVDDGICMLTDKNTPHAVMVLLWLEVHTDKSADSVVGWRMCVGIKSTSSTLVQAVYQF